MLIALIFLYIVTLAVVIYLVTVEDPIKKIEVTRDPMRLEIGSLRDIDIVLLRDLALEHDREILMLKRRLQAYKMGYEECPDNYSGKRVCIDQYGHMHDVELVDPFGWCYAKTSTVAPITFRKKASTKKAKKKA